MLQHQKAPPSLSLSSFVDLELHLRPLSLSRITKTFSYEEALPEKYGPSTAVGCFRASPLIFAGGDFDFDCSSVAGRQGGVGLPYILLLRQLLRQPPQDHHPEDGGGGWLQGRRRPPLVLQLQLLPVLYELLGEVGFVAEPPAHTRDNRRV